LLTIKGKKSDINHAAAILDEMRGTFTSKGTLLSDDVDNLIKLYKSGEIDLKSNLDITNVIYYGRKGAISPRTKGQSIYLESVSNNDIVFGIGPAGTGKTFLSMAFALSSLEKKEVERIILCRPAVEAGENLGFLPGDLKEKVDPYLSPLYDALDAMLPKNKLAILIENKNIEIVPLAYMRGRTLDNAFMILDEAQNSTIMQMKMFLTRLGIGSKAIINGDVTQIDLDANKHSGLIQATKILNNVSGIGFTYFDDSDIVRHPLVRKIIGAYDTVDKENGIK
jgi:phosphate starvation-inducible PhoH-like protein